jgi:ABC-2 type transport system permease protein
MRTILFLVQKEFIQIFRNRTMLPLILLMPVLQTLLLSFAASYEVKGLSLTVVDHDHSTASRRLVSLFTASGYFRLQAFAGSYKEAEHYLASDSADMVLEIPPHFERDWVREGGGSLGLTIHALNAQKAGLANAYSGGIVREFNRYMLEEWGPRLGNFPKVPPLEVAHSNWYNPHLDYKAFMVPGILSVIVSLVIAFLTAINLVREREKGTMEQLNVTPVQKWQFILGKLLPFWALSLVMMSVGLFIGWLVFRIPMEGSLWLVYAYTATFTPCMLGFGFLISNFADTQQQAMFSAWFFLLIFILMSGLFTPADSMPVWAQWLNKLNPVHYFVAFMRAVLLKGATFGDISANYFSVLGYAALVNTLAVWTYKKRAE